MALREERGVKKFIKYKNVQDKKAFKEKIKL